MPARATNTKPGSFATIAVFGLWTCVASPQEIRQPDIAGSILRGRIAAEQIQRMRAESELLEAQRRALEAEAASSPLHPNESLRERIDAAIRKRVHLFPDFESVAFNPDLRVTLEMLEFASGSAYAADILYFLGKNPDESAAISVMSRPDMARRITQIESQAKLAEK